MDVHIAENPLSTVGKTIISDDERNNQERNYRLRPAFGFGIKLYPQTHAPVSRNKPILYSFNRILLWAILEIFGLTGVFLGLFGLFVDAQSFLV